VQPHVCVVVLQTPFPLQLASVRHVTHDPVPVSQYGAVVPQSALDEHWTHIIVEVLQ